MESNCKAASYYYYYYYFYYYYYHYYYYYYYCCYYYCYYYYCCCCKASARSNTMTAIENICTITKKPMSKKSGDENKVVSNEIASIQSSNIKLDNTVYTLSEALKP